MVVFIMGWRVSTNMGIGNKLRSMFRTEGSAETSYEYECQECGATFESEQTRFDGLTCPTCGSNNIRDIELAGDSF